MRFAVVGIAVNGLVFLGYLGLVQAGLPPLWAMTLIYAVGMTAGFALNRRVTFTHDGPGRAAAGRYLAAYGAGYILNLAGLAALTGWFHVPHVWAQGGMVGVVAVVMFVLQRVWVFPDRVQRAAAEGE